MKPNFLVLGTAKAGTTSLNYYLDKQPNVCTAIPKETWFFDSSYHKGMDYYWDTYFKNWDGQKIVGEVSTSYLYVPYVPSRIKESVPDAKLIVILRNPVDRAYSDWWMMYVNGIENLSFEDAVADNMKRIQSSVHFNGTKGEERWKDHLSSIKYEGKLKYRTYVDYGYYSEQLRRYFDIFPKEQIKVFFFEQLLHDKGTLIKELFEFIGADDVMADESLTLRNVAMPNRSISKLVRTMKALKVDKVIPGKMKERVMGMIANNFKKPVMDSRMRSWLTDHYKPYNDELSALIGCYLSHWNIVEGKND